MLRSHTPSRAQHRKPHNTTRSLHNNKKHFSTTATTTKQKPVKHKASGVDYEFALPPTPHDNYNVVIGLETHAQIATKSKAFSGASTTFKSPPNTNTALFDAAIPGTLPNLNSACVDAALRTGLALGGKVNRETYFHRKQYFYCDMPTGYQITQNFPIITGGSVSLDSLLPAGMSRSVGISHIQLEHDSGKSLHDVSPGKTHVDLNRAGVALMEIVTTPTIYSAHEAVLYLKKLQALLRFLGTSNANLEEGSMRCDVNVTVQRVEPPGEMSQRIEIKNMNSFKHILYAIQSEAMRQINILEEEYAQNPNMKSKDSSIQRETRGYDHKTDTTHRLRSKENLLDYRFFPEPDLPPLTISVAAIDAAKAAIPILPDVRHKYLLDVAGLTQKEGNVIIQEDKAFEYFCDVLTTPTKISAENPAGEQQELDSLEEYHQKTDATGSSSQVGVGAKKMKVLRSAKTTNNWLTNELFGRIKRYRETNDADSTQRYAALLDTNLVTPEQLATVIDLVLQEKVSGKQAKSLLDTIFQSVQEVEDPSELCPMDMAQELNLLMDNNPDRVKQLVDLVLQLYPQEVEQFVVKGKKNQFGFLTGQVIKLSQQQGGGELNGKMISQILTQELDLLKQQGDSKLWSSPVNRWRRGTTQCSAFLNYFSHMYIFFLFILCIFYLKAHR